MKSEIVSLDSSRKKYLALISLSEVTIKLFCCIILKSISKTCSLLKSIAFNMRCLLKYGYSNKQPAITSQLSIFPFICLYVLLSFFILID